MTKQQTQRPAWSYQWRLAQPDGMEGIKPVWIKPGALDAGDTAFEVRDRCDQCWPRFRLRIRCRAVETTRMEPQGIDSGKCLWRDPTPVQIGFSKGAWEGLRHAEQPPSGALGLGGIRSGITAIIRLGPGDSTSTK
ncbi:hypothetical protein MXAZACID_17446 [Acidocella sp. MX-AZ02]|nr:hypothetical protein MXAZACID_17446 [Acidocella sp. MX-AZ02]